MSPVAFRPIYLLITAAAAICVAWFVGPAANLTYDRDREAAVNRTGRSVLSGGTVAALSLVILILVGYIVAVVRWEDFADYDDSFFTLITLRGHNLMPPIWPASGRFFPLGRQEYNLVRHFASSVVGYHVVPIAELLIVCCILFVLDDALSIKARAGLTAACLLLPSVVSSFTGLVYPESDVVFWLVCLLFFVKLFVRNQSTIWAVAAAICAQNMIYYKETAFLLVLGFAAGRLILRCRRAEGKGWDFNRLRDRQSRLDICFICLALLFLLSYAVVMIGHHNLQYADLYKVSWGQALFYYFRLDPLALVLVAVTLRRAYLILLRRSAPLLLWDGLAFGGVACYAAYLDLGLCMPYYLAPVDVIAVLYVGRLVVLSWAKLRTGPRIATSALVIAVLVHNVSLSAFRVYERENVIHAKSLIADAIAAQSQRDLNHTQRLFIPFSTPYIIAEYASYLTYRGVRVEGYEGAAKPGAPSITISGGDFTQDGPCVNYMNFVCHASNDPASGDLVIELPDDVESAADLNRYRSGGDLLFSYEPRPRIAPWMEPLLGYLHVISFPFWYKDLPDRWLHASITKWP